MKHYSSEPKAYKKKESELATTLEKPTLIRQKVPRKRLSQRMKLHACYDRFNMLMSTSLSASKGTRDGANEAHGMSNCIGLHYALIKILGSKKIARNGD